MSYHIGLQVLRSKIRGFHAAGTTITARISKAEKERKGRLWNQKRSLGLHCRYHLVAYGLLRGVPYDQIERCAPNNKLNPKVILDIMLAHNGWDPRRGTQKYDLERVKSLLSPGPFNTVATSDSSTDISVSRPIGIVSANLTAVPVQPATPSSWPHHEDKNSSSLPKKLSFGGIRRWLEKRA
jgi:hypothetical protein